jgi:hypothetical protein
MCGYTELPRYHTENNPSVDSLFVIWILLTSKMFKWLKSLFIKPKWKPTVCTVYHHKKEWWYVEENGEILLVKSVLEKVPPQLILESLSPLALDYFSNAVGILDLRGKVFLATKGGMEWSCDKHYNFTTGGPQIIDGLPLKVELHSIKPTTLQGQQKISPKEETVEFAAEEDKKMMKKVLDAVHPSVIIDVLPRDALVYFSTAHAIEDLYRSVHFETNGKMEWTTCRTSVLQQQKLERPKKEHRKRQNTEGIEEKQQKKKRPIISIDC